MGTTLVDWRSGLHHWSKWTTHIIFFALLITRPCLAACKQDKISGPSLKKLLCIQLDLCNTRHMTGISSSPSRAYIWRTSQHQQTPTFGFRKCGYSDAVARESNTRTALDYTKIKYTVMRCTAQSRSKSSTNINSRLSILFLLLLLKSMFIWILLYSFLGFLRAGKIAYWFTNSALTHKYTCKTDDKRNRTQDNRHTISNK